MTDQESKEKLLEPFRIALQLEQEGRAFFLEAAAKTESSLARQTFEFLAKEEDKHIQKIEEFVQSLELTEGAGPFDIGDSDAHNRLKEFDDRLAQIKDEYQLTNSDADAYRMALEFENGAEDFYQEKMDEATDPLIKKFYKWLIDEEAMHSRLLNSCIKFVEDPAGWFARRRA